MSLTHNLKEDLSEARRKLAAAEGERSVLARRRDELERDVGLAKGRLALKSGIDTFLEELQAEAHMKRVGDFERLLSALVTEVLPGEPPIGLDLEIDRGQPSLDIVTRRGADRSEDIFDDQGGALTNVVSMGLRMIAAVRSGTRRFLVFDESDCWIETKRVPAFYKVLKEAARKLDVQCFAISHHDISSFDEGVNIARLSGNKDSGVMIENAPKRYRWSDDEEGIRYIRLQNFQPFVDETIHLSPGVNALTGRNNLGKSVLVRALRAVFQGETRDTLIRHGEKRCCVEIGFAGGRVLHWNRQLRRNPVNVWKMLGPDGAVIKQDGMVYESGGRTAPDWVLEQFGIGTIEGLDVHVNKQKSPVFLLDKPGATRAAVLSVGQESGMIRDMIALHKERSTQDNAKVRDGEKEMAAIVARLDALTHIDSMKEKLEQASKLLDAVDRRMIENEKLGRICGALADARNRGRKLSTIGNILSALPTHDEVDALRRKVSAQARLETVVQKLENARSQQVRTQRIASALSKLPERMPEIRRSDELISIGRRIREGKAALVRLDQQRRILAELPSEMPKLRDTSALLTVEKQIVDARARKIVIDKEAVMISDKMKACEVSLKKLVEDLGHSCPVCGGGIDDPHVLLGHAHHAEGA